MHSSSVGSRVNPQTRKSKLPNGIRQKQHSSGGFSIIRPIQSTQGGQITGVWHAIKPQSETKSERISGVLDNDGQTDGHRTRCQLPVKTTLGKVKQSQLAGLNGSSSNFL